MRSLRYYGFLLVAAFAACASSSQKMVMIDGQQVPVDEAANRGYQNAKQKQAAGDKAGARQELQLVAATYPGTDKAAEARYDLANEAFDSNDFSEAKKRFGELLLEYPTHRLAQPSRKRYAQASFKLGDHRDAIEALRTSVTQSQGEERKEILAMLLASARALGDGATQLEVLSLELENAGSEADKQAAEKRIIEVVDHDLGPEDADRLLANLPSSLQFAYEPLLLKSAKLSRHTGDFVKAKSRAETLVGRNAGGVYAADAKTLLAELADLNQVNPLSVGVVLPLSGRLRDFGQSSLEAIKLAFAANKDLEVQLIVRDSAGEAEKAQAAVEELVRKEHVMAILGPLFAEESVAAAVRSASLGVPMINLSRKEGIPQIGERIFRLCMTVKQQAQTLANVAVDTLGYKRFAMMYPNQPAGSEFAQAFWDAIEAKKAEMRAVESYEHDQTTFTSQVKRMVGRQALDARADYLAAMQEIAKNKELSPIQRQRAQEKLLKSLEPITDFDAILIPDSSKPVGLIVPAILAEDVILTTDKRALETVAKTTGRKNLTPIRLLGGNGWNSPKTVERGGKDVEGAVFVDGFFAADAEPRVQKFVKQFREATKSEPTLPDAQAFDAASLLREALLKGAKDRAALVEQLKAITGFVGVTGKLGFDAEGEALRDLILLTIEKGQIVRFDVKAAG